MSDKSDAEKKKRFLIIVIIAIAVIAVLVAVIVFMSRDGQEPAEQEPVEQRNTVVTPENVDEVVDEILAEEGSTGPPASYSVKMTTTWNFEDGSSPSENAYVENVTDNTTAVYFDVMIEDTGEVILESPVIPVGSYMSGITLDKDLDAGTYDCVMIYYLIDEEQNPLTELRVTLVIEVEN